MSEVFAIELKHLKVNYHQHCVLWDVNCALPQGKMAALIGPNGAGKSTFMKALLGLIRPSYGEAKIFGKPIKSQLKTIAYIPQRETVDWDFPMTVEELVLQGRYRQMGLFKWARKKDKQAVHQALEKVKMASYAKRQISELSIGQQQRIFLARSMLLEADLYFMDEPCSGVDAITEQLIFEQLKAFQKAGKTIVVIHHDLSKVPQYFDWVMMLNVSLIASGPIETTFNELNLEKTFGKNTTLFEEAFKRSKEKMMGKKCFS